MTFAINHNEKMFTPLLFTFICLFIVRVKRIMKYMTRIGQNTGMLRASKHVHIVATRIAFVNEYLQKKSKPLVFVLYLSLNTQN